MEAIDQRIAELVEREEVQITALRKAALAKRTLASYNQTWAMFLRWCIVRGQEPTDPGVLVVWMHTRWEKRPSTMRRYANAASWHCRRSGLPDPANALLLQRFLSAHARFHGVAPLECNTVQPFDQAQLLAVVAAPMVVRGPMGLSDDRGRAAVLLAWHGVPMSQMIRIAQDGVYTGDTGVTLALPTTSGPGMARALALEGKSIVLEHKEGVLDPGQIVALAQAGPRRPLLLGVATVAGGGRNQPAVAVDPIVTPHGVASVLVSQLQRAARRARLPVRSFADVAALTEVEVTRLWLHINISYSTELRTRCHVAVLTELGARHSDLAAVSVETIKTRDAFLHLFVECSKTDQDGVGEWRRLFHSVGHPPTCPACLTQQWIAEAGLTAGPLFPALGYGGVVKPRPLAVEEAAAEIQRLALQVGVPGRVGTHTPRKTHATLRARNGEEAADIALTTGQDPGVVLRHYVKPARPFEDTAQL